MIARVSLSGANRDFDQPFAYLVPAELEDRIAVGQVVAVPFGRRREPSHGYVLGIKANEDSDLTDVKLKTVEAILTATPVVNEEQIRLAVDMRKRYFCSFSQALDCMIPPRIRLIGAKKTRFARLVDPDLAEAMLELGQFRSQAHIRVVELLLTQGDLSVAEIRAAADVSPSVMQTLTKNKIIETYPVEVERNILEEDVVESVRSPELRPAQQAALDRLTTAFNAASEGKLKEYLLHGVTGSGKTEVYLNLAENVLAAGQTVLFLVPEIALTPQMESRIRSRFGEAIAVIHSRMTLTERYETWQKISRGERRIVVGARSAIFAPLTNIGLIVIDEEHEATYKSGVKPRYHATDIARLRALRHDALLLLGSATPSIETYRRTKDGRSTLLTLPDRIGTAGRVRINIVDMKGVPKTEDAAVISEPLQQALGEALSRGEQAMILINRRGHMRLTICQACGHVMMCGSCEVALVQHLNPHSKHQDSRLYCHHCDRIYPLPTVCPACSAEALNHVGYGTQRVMEVLARLYPKATLLRMDQDTTLGRHAHEALLSRYASKEVDILVGTQMIAKGHDFPNTTVVGILSADQLLNGDEFRATERGFSMMLQASGRAGRGDLPGHVFIQAYNTDEPILRDVVQHDYDAFYRRETAYRQRLALPPFGHIGLVRFSGLSDGRTRDDANRFFALCQEARSRYTQYQVLTLHAPAAAPLRRLRNRYRYRLIVKGNDLGLLTEFLALIDDTAKKTEVTRALDVNPWSLL